MARAPDWTNPPCTFSRESIQISPLHRRVQAADFRRDQRRRAVFHSLCLMV